MFQHSGHSRFQLITLGNNLGEKRKEREVNAHVLPDTEFYTQSQPLNGSVHATPPPQGLSSLGFFIALS